jgi:hypothetical protein
MPPQGILDKAMNGIWLFRSEGNLVFGCISACELPLPGNLIVASAPTRSKMLLMDTDQFLGLLSQRDE